MKTNTITRQVELNFEESTYVLKGTIITINNKTQEYIEFQDHYDGNSNIFSRKIKEDFKLSEFIDYLCLVRGYSNTMLTHLMAMYKI